MLLSNYSHMYSVVVLKYLPVPSINKIILKLTYTKSYRISIDILRVKAYKINYAL